MRVGKNYAVVQGKQIVYHRGRAMVGTDKAFIEKWLARTYTDTNPPLNNKAKVKEIQIIVAD